jgi:hypothetical protein
VIATDVRGRGHVRLPNHRILRRRHQQREPLEHAVVDNGTEPVGTRGASEYIAP